MDSTGSPSDSPVYSVAKAGKKWRWVVWSRASDVRGPSDSMGADMVDPAGSGAADSKDAAMAAISAISPSAEAIGSIYATGMKHRSQQRDRARSRACRIAGDIERAPHLLRLAAAPGVSLETLRRAYNAEARSPVATYGDDMAVLRFALEILQGEHADVADAVMVATGTLTSGPADVSALLLAAGMSVREASEHV